MTFTIGCDPEIFLTRNGKAVSAHGMIPGTKAAPHPVPSGAIQVDGMAVEFNTAPVVYTDFNAFNENICRVVSELKKAVKEKDPSVSFAIMPTMTFDEEYLAAQPDDAKELGCDPDYSAYTLKHNPRPDGEVPFRTASGHLHVGWGADIPVDNEDHIQICADFVKMLDATVGLVMCYIDRDPRRRELYGKAGAFRPKPYGVEYRTPSNVWLRNKTYREAVHFALKKAIYYMQRGSTTASVWGLAPESIQNIIDTGDWKRARKMLEMVFSPYDRLTKRFDTAVTTAYTEKEAA